MVWGEQHNFVSQSFALKDARSIITLKATRSVRGQIGSNIVWSYGAETIPRHLRDIIVTEYGVADLRGKSDQDVIAAMLSVADSRFQPELLRQAREAQKTSGGVPNTECLSKQHAGPDCARLGSVARSWALCPTPVWDDFTSAEADLMPALRVLDDAAHSPIRLLNSRFMGMTA